MKKISTEIVMIFVLIAIIGVFIIVASINETNSTNKINSLEMELDKVKFDKRMLELDTSTLNTKINILFKVNEFNNRK